MYFFVRVWGGGGKALGFSVGLHIGRVASQDLGVWVLVVCSGVWTTIFDRFGGQSGGCYDKAGSLVTHCDLAG